MLTIRRHDGQLRYESLPVTSERRGMLGYMSDYLTTGQVARTLGLSINALQQWAKDGIVTPEFTTPGGRMRWTVDGLLAQLGGTPAAVRPAETVTPVPVALVLITAREGVVIGQRAEPPPPWSFPGGEIEDGESAQDTARRVALEDARLLIRPGAIIGQRTHPVTNRRVTYVAANPAGRDHAVSAGDDTRYREVKWATLTEATELMPDMAAEALAHLQRVMRRR